ncbi:MAG TPA: prolyl oligopeptidase family serine peptidase, partial [Longimicrobiales bacterium]
AYRLVPGDGDATLVLRAVEGDRVLAVARGTDPTFTDDSRFLVFKVEPTSDEDEAAGTEETEEAEEGEEDAEAEEAPDTLAIVDLSRVSGGDASAAVTRIPRLQSFQVPEEGASLVAYLLESEEDEADEAEEGEEERPAARAGRGGRGGGRGAARGRGSEEDKKDGSPLVLRNLATGTEHRFEMASEYAFSEDGASLTYAASSEDGTADGVFRVNAASGATTPLLTGEGRYSRLTVSEGTAVAAFLTNRDEWGADQPAYALYAAGPQAAEAIRLAGPDAPGIPEGWGVSERGEVSFSDSGQRVFFGTAPVRDAVDDEDETDPDDEVRVDVWNWRDDYLQPMQLVRAEEDRDRTYQAWVSVDGGPVVQLATEDVTSISLSEEGDGSVALGETDLPYRQLISWDGTYQDVYVIDMATGERRLLAEKLAGAAGSLSPTGRYVSWWDGVERHWYVANVATGETVNVTAALPHPLHNVLDDHPDEPPPYGTAGWTEGDARFLVNDEFDVWAVDPGGVEPPRNLTEGVGRRDGIRFRYARTDPELDFVPWDEDVLLSAFDPTTKDAGFFQDRFDRQSPPREILMGPHSYSAPRKAEDGDRLLLTRQSFVEFPDLWVANGDLRAMERMSDANPQQAEYAWGTAELVEWTSNDGIPLQGILYKPEGFDPTQQYPMMVYFYERSSDGLHGYAVPAAGSSSISRSFYVSRGYLLFVPDIPYEIGHPGESALDAVVPGVLALVDEGFVKRDRIGVQGHSWGGYQIAYMVTKTNLFAAAEAGAPVSNMTSAYGGIRWQSGMSRMFQYERTQSRIGGTLWNAQHLYVENSPIFGADKIRTPVLMMHNDEDGAVPWYQGIEMFVAMRRLQKPVWMLNYNGEAHGLRRAANQKDWAIRMQQFFDHYLMDAPPAVWMVDGVPAVMKGETLGLELVTDWPVGRPIMEEESGGS